MNDLERIVDWAPPADLAARQLDLKAWTQDFRDVYQISEALSKTPFVPREMFGKQADVAAAIMKGRELGLDPFDALGSIYIVHGRVGYYAEFLRRRIIQAGHTLRIVENTDSRCVIEAVRKDTAETHRASFTSEQARKAAIDLGKYPADKLVARATSRLCRQVFPDVLSGSLIAEDLIDGLIPADDTAAPEPTAVAARPVQRRRAPKAAKAAATQPAPAPKQDDSDDVAELLGDTPEPEPEPEPEPVDRSDEIAETDDVTEEQAIGNLTEAGLLPEPITDDQLKLMMARFRARGFTDRASRLDYTKAVISRDIDSAKDLTKEEASKVIDSLEN